MTLDHIGYYLFPAVVWLRIVGRLAFPIFAYMVGEGMAHTRNLTRYFLTMVATAAVCQGVMYCFTRDLYQSVFVTFSMSIGLGILVKNATEKKNALSWIFVGVAIAAAYGICEILPSKVSGFRVDYDFLGVLAPVGVYLGKSRFQKLFYLGICLLGLAANTYWVQWFAFLAIPLLLLYNGQRGKWKLKWFFYLYFPLHTAILHGLAWLL